MTSWQTVRLRNADGTSTVYKVHDSVNTQGSDDCNSSSMFSSASLPPEVLLGGGGGGGNIHHCHPSSPMSAMNTSYTASSHYGHHNTTYSAHSPMQPPHSQAPVIILKPTRKQTKNSCVHKCSRSNNPLCITLGVLLSISIIIGYVSLIVFLIPGSTKDRWEVHDRDVRSSSTATTVDSTSGNYGQQQLSKQQFMRNGADSSPMLASSSSSTTVIDSDGIPKGHSYHAIMTILDPADEPQTRNQSPPELPREEVANNHAGEPVRRLKRRRGRRKQKILQKFK